MILWHQKVSRGTAQYMVTTQITSSLSGSGVLASDFVEDLIQTHPILPSKISPSKMPSSGSITHLTDSDPSSVHKPLQERKTSVLNLVGRGLSITLKAIFFALTVLPLAIAGAIIGVVKAFIGTVYERYHHYKEKHATDGAKIRWDIRELHRSYRCLEITIYDKLIAELNSYLPSSLRFKTNLLADDCSVILISSMSRESLARAISILDTDDDNPKKNQALAKIQLLIEQTKLAGLIEGLKDNDKLNPTRRDAIWKKFQLDANIENLCSIKNKLNQLNLSLKNEFTETLTTELLGQYKQLKIGQILNLTIILMNARAITKSSLVRSRIFCTDCCFISNSKSAHQLPPLIRAMLVPLHPAFFLTLFGSGLGMGFWRVCNMWFFLTLFGKDKMDEKVPNQFPVRPKHMFAFGEGRKFYHMFKCIDPNDPYLSSGAPSRITSEQHIQLLNRYINFETADTLSSPPSSEAADKPEATEISNNNFTSTQPATNNKRFLETAL